MVVPKLLSIITRLLQEYHGSPVAGHARDVKTYLRLAAEWQWQGMRKGVATYVQQCAVC